MSNKKRIGLVLPNHPSYSETFFISKIKGLQQNGMEVVLFTNAPKSKNFILCQVVNLKTKLNFFGFVKESFLFLYLFSSQFKRFLLLFNLNKKDNMSLLKNLKNLFLNRYFLNQKLDWLHFGFGTMALERENVAAAIYAKMAVSFRGFDLYIYPVKHPNCYSILWKKEVRYHVLSNEMYHELINNGIKKSNIFKITPAIDVVQFNSIKELKNKESDIKIISVGRLHWIKGYHYVLDALALLKDKGIEFKYSIIGDGIEKERLMFQVHQLGLKDNVFFYGKVDHDELRKIYNQNDIFIQYSVQEGFCNAALEAQAMGLLCIVSDADGLSENVFDGKTGWVIPKRSPLALSNALIKKISLSDTEKDKIKSQARDRVANHYNLEKQLEEFVSFYVN